MTSQIRQGSSSGTGPVNKKSSSNEPRVNEEIRVPEVRLISEGETQYGVVSILRAREIAQELALDLVEISPNANPPVVKLIDYGKYKYQLQKKQSEAKKKQVKISLKEIKFRPAIDQHDLEVKLKNIKRFLEDGDKVKLMMQFRGREMAHKELGLGKFNDIVVKIQEEFGAVVESPVKMMGNRAFCMLAPSKKA